MSFLRAARSSRVSIAGLAIIGVVWGGFSAIVPDIKAHIGASDAEMGLSLIMSAVGGMLSMWAAPRIMAVVGHRIYMLAGAIVVPVILLLSLPASPLGLGLVMFAMGASVSLLDITANIRISIQEEREGLHLMNLNHAMFSFAFAAAAIAASLARQSGVGPAGILPGMALACFLLAAMMRTGSDGAQAAQPAPDTPARSPWPVILPVAAILFASFICENATEVWSALHIERTLGGAAGHGGFGPAMLGLTMGIGRLSGQAASKRFGESGLVLWSSALGASGALVLALAPVPAVAFFGAGMLGLGVAVVVPSANSILGRLVRSDQRGYALSRAWMIGFTGFFIGPSAIGLISELSSLRVAFVVVALIAATIIPCILYLRRRGA